MYMVVFNEADIALINQSMGRREIKKHVMFSHGLG